VLVSEDDDLVPVAPAPPQKLGGAHVERRGHENPYAAAHDLVERRQERLGLAADERVHENRVLAVSHRVGRHGGRHPVADA
jgi:hypothetical protein